nr:CRISPR system precrRNA processing endoribonuclease RAMP protein Cas6 [Candidatus Sigynarchaeota archaeon]
MAGIPQVEPVQWAWAGHVLVHCKIDVIALNDATVELYTMTGCLGMMYALVEVSNPRLSKALHATSVVKPWSFSLLKMDTYQKTGEKGKYVVKKGTRGYWIVNTIDPGVRDATISLMNSGAKLHFNRLELGIEKIEHHDLSYAGYPETGIDTITVQLHSPTFFYEAATKRMVPFTSRAYIDFQLRKLKDAGIVAGYSIDDIDPFIRVLRDDTTEKWLQVSSPGKPGIVSRKGKVGFVTFKLSGDDDARQIAWEIIHASQFTGIGSRTSMGFGHNSIKSFKDS